MESLRSVARRKPAHARTWYAGFVVDRDDLALRLGRALARKEGVRLALLFGSRARGRAQPSSDIDLAIDAPGVDLQALAGALSLELGGEVDIVALRDATIPLLEGLICDGILVHEARPGTAATWRSKALVELETDRPWYRRMRDAWIARVAERGIVDGQ